MSRRVQQIIILALISLNIGCDQVSKVIAREKIDSYEKIHIVGDNFYLTKTENTGAFLGMGSNLNPLTKTIFLLILPAIVMVVLFGYVLFKKSLTKLEILGLTFIVGGGIGNIYDRILYGSVTDFLFMDFEIFKTGIFNMADVSVMIGTFVLLINTFISGKKGQNTNSEDQKPHATEDLAEVN